MRVLHMLTEVGPRQSTVWVNDTLSLVASYVVEGFLGKTRPVTGKLIDSQNTMFYEGMLFYAVLLRGRSTEVIAELNVWREEL